ncbi:MAG: glutathione S-transferase family protein [Alphaproteobacteria bacterium]|jgi:glutathione S-transferase|nr:glutathione S-transferase family protein [Alphaproteobacteria bacterium]
MVQLLDSDLRTREVLAWRGVHILHGRMSSCSQKLRIFLNLKGIEWEGHELNLAESETYSDWFLGINPRGLVPVLVRDGAVHIESNDILALLDTAFPEPRLIPAEQELEIAALLQQEDDLHLDLRTLSFRFVMGRTTSNKTPEMLARYDDGNGTVNGAPDHARRAPEIEFYQRLASEGIPDKTVRASAEKFRAAFDDFESRLSSAPFLLGQSITVIDIAWYVYASRLQFAGYPFARCHPRVHAWWEKLSADGRFSSEVQLPPPLRESITKNHTEWARNGTMFVDVTGW